MARELSSSAHEMPWMGLAPLPARRYPSDLRVAQKPCASGSSEIQEVPPSVHPMVVHCHWLQISTPGTEIYPPVRFSGSCL